MHGESAATLNIMRLYADRFLQPQAPTRLSCYSYDDTTKSHDLLPRHVEGFRGLPDTALFGRSYLKLIPAKRQRPDSFAGAGLALSRGATVAQTPCIQLDKHCPLIQPRQD